MLLLTCAIPEGSSTQLTSQQLLYAALKSHKEHNIRSWKEMVRIDCHKRAYAKINILESCTIKQNHTSYNFMWLLVRLDIHTVIKEKTGLCFKASNIFTYNYFIHKCLQGPTVCYAICCRKTWLLFYLAFCIAKTCFLFCTLKDQNKSNIYQNNRGIGLLAGFQ